MESPINRGFTAIVVKFQVGLKRKIIA